MSCHGVQDTDTTSKPCSRYSVAYFITCFWRASSQLIITHTGLSIRLSSLPNDKYRIWFVIAKFDLFFRRRNHKMTSSALGWCESGWECYTRLRSKNHPCSRFPFAYQSHGNPPNWACRQFLQALTLIDRQIKLNSSVDNKEVVFLWLS